MATAMASNALAASRGSAARLLQKGTPGSWTAAARRAAGLGLAGSQRRLSSPAPCAPAMTVAARPESRRHYVKAITPRKPVPSKPKPAPAGPTLQEARTRSIEFDESDVPSVAFWDKARTRLVEIHGMDPEAAPLNTSECDSLARAYMRATVDDEGEPLFWPPDSPPSSLVAMGFPLEHLHYLAIQIMASGEFATMPPGLARLALRMLDHATYLNHMPSILTVCLLALQQLTFAGRTGFGDLKPPFSTAISRFRSLFRSSAASGSSNGSPDVLAVWGLIQLVDGNPGAAEKFLRRALGPVLPPPSARNAAAGAAATAGAPEADIDLTPRPPRFDSEGSALVGLATAMERLGRPVPDMAACLAIAAFQLDLPDACLQLGLMTGVTRDPDNNDGGSSNYIKYVAHTETLLTKAATSGLPPAWKAMAAIELFKAQQARKGVADLSHRGLGPIGSPKKHEMAAAEWNRIFDAAG